MDTNEFVLLKLLFLAFWVNTWMMSGTSASDTFNLEPTITWQRRLCNESRLRWEVEVCGEDFKRDMAHVDPQQWCNLTHFMSGGSMSLNDEHVARLFNTDELLAVQVGIDTAPNEYHLFTLCTETKAHNVDCYWPNPLVESYIIRIHKHLFSNCTIEEVIWMDPPDDTLTVLILIPVFLTLAMIALVVWCSKRSDLLA